MDIDTPWYRDLQDDKERVLAVTAGTGTVLVKKMSDRKTLTYEVSDTITASGVYRYQLGYGPTRIEATGNAKFEVWG